MRALIALAGLAVALSACASKDSPSPEASSDSHSAAPAAYKKVLGEMKQLGPNDGWTLALATQFADNACADLRDYSYEDVVQSLTEANGGDRASAQGGVIAAVVYVCPDLKEKVPGLP